MHGSNMKLLFPKSNIPSNIGNGFFYLGVEFVLDKISDNLTVVDCPFPPHNPFRLSIRQTSDTYHLPEHLCGYDAVVLAGPILDRNFANQHGPLLRSARRQGKPIILLSCGGRQYDEVEIASCSALLSEIEPDILVSRDHDTYSNYAKFCKNAYDGICFAFFVSDAYQKFSMTIKEEFCIACFDFDRERPLQDYISLETGTPELKRRYALTGTKSFKNKFLMSAQRSFKTKVDGIRVVRPSHRPIRSARHIFHKPNSFADFSFASYLHLYANTLFTITDRLHAAVATLAFGRPAHLPLRSNRSKLLQAAGCEDVLSKFYVADLKKLDEYKSCQTSWLENALHSLEG